jgi:hypothetical protein
MNFQLAATLRQTPVAIALFTGVAAWVVDRVAEDVIEGAPVVEYATEWISAETLQSRYRDSGRTVNDCFTRSSKTYIETPNLLEIRLRNVSAKTSVVLQSLAIRPTEAKAPKFIESFSQAFSTPRLRTTDIYCSQHSIDLNDVDIQPSEVSYLVVSINDDYSPRFAVTLDNKTPVRLEPLSPYTWLLWNRTTILITIGLVSLGFVTTLFFASLNTPKPAGTQSEK